MRSESSAWRLPMATMRSPRPDADDDPSIVRMPRLLRAGLERDAQVITHMPPAEGERRQKIKVK